MLRRPVELTLSQLIVPLPGSLKQVDSERLEKGLFARFPSEVQTG